jgi:hypothetical protein
MVVSPRHPSAAWSLIRSTGYDELFTYHVPPR